MTAGSFAPIGGRPAGIGGDNSFWPSFTDVMMVITLIFLMATSLLVVRNWQLVAELQESVAAERMAAELIESTSQENATLEERLANAEQSNSILRLRLLKKDEELAAALATIRERDSSIATLETQNRDLGSALEQNRADLDETRSRLEIANLELDTATAQFSEMSQQIEGLQQQIAEQQRLAEQSRSQLAEARGAIDSLRGELATARGDLAGARGEIERLSATSSSQQQDIAELTRERSLLNEEIAAYNQQLLTLRGDYETVKSKYEELIKPARSAKGKFIAEVYYVKGESGDVIRYREPGDQDYSRLSLAEVERRLERLKQEQGQNLYVKIIIPQDSGLSYNEAWSFMRNLLVKYDYYYQE